MVDETRVQQLLDELLDSDATPETVCGSCPELLDVVRERWGQIQRLNGQLDAFFPTPHALSSQPQTKSLPSIQGYEVQEVIGRGGMGIVYRATHLRLDRQVALKMLLVGDFATLHERVRFQREAEAIAQLKHPNIVQIYDVGDNDGRPYFTMELLDGGSLAQDLSGTPQPARRVAALVATLSEAVHAAHEGGIVHRDLKPGNILLTRNGTPKIVDFGLARHFEGETVLTMSGAWIGTPSYMAPEQVIAKAGTIGPAADVYGLGAVLYEMLTGRPPFRGESAAETQRQVIYDDPAPPSRLVTKIPRDLETICLKCLAKDQKRRYPSAAALADDLRRYLDGLPLRARPVGWPERAWRWGRRNPMLSTVMILSLALVGLAVGGGFWLEQQEADRRAENARLEGKQSNAVEAMLTQIAGLQKQGRWPEAKVVLAGAPNLDDFPKLTRLRKRLNQAIADVNMVTKLEDIPIRQVEVRASSAHRQYVAAFHDYQIDLPTSNIEEAAKQLRESAICETLVAYLHDWMFHWGSKKEQDQLAAILDIADDDPWRRRLRSTLRGAYDPVERHDLLQAPEALNQPPQIFEVVYSFLNTGIEGAEALALVRAAQLLRPEDYWINIQLGGILMKEHPEQAVGYFRAAVASRPGSSQAYIMLGRALHDSGDTDGAIAAFRIAIPLTSIRCAPRDLAKALASRGGLDEARIAWAAMLAKNPPHFDPWDGYALLCAFLGDDEAFRAARISLLNRTRDADEHWTAAERDSMACLVKPASGQELDRSVALVKLAVTTGPKYYPRRAWTQFVEGLAAYRQGRPELAIPLLEESADLLPNRAGPRLALAMAQFQSGSIGEARKTLATAVAASNWMQSQADHPSAWVSHVLHREAEDLILPKLQAFLSGEYEPQENDERLALVGICQYQRRYAAAAQLYASAFEADPSLMERLTTDCRFRSTEDEPFYERVESLNTDGLYLAARCATLAGSGQGDDQGELGQSEKSRLRRQAREWLRTGLALWTKTLANDIAVDLSLARRMLQRWQVEPDLAGIRDLYAMNEYSAEERNECFELWDEIRATLRRIVLREQDFVRDPKLGEPWRVLPSELLRQGKLDEARQAWEMVLKANPIDHNVWSGYAELCLFLGRVSEYRAARRELLGRFFLTSNAYFAERTGRACLMLPESYPEQPRAIALARRAAAVDPADAGNDFHWFLFARGLAEYRAAQFEDAITTMRDIELRMGGPNVRLVLAMALQQVGQSSEARKNLARAILTQDWGSVNARDSGAWISHLLRREAEGLLLPNREEYRRGEYQPANSEERLAFIAADIAASEFAGLQVIVASLSRDAVAADPKLAADASNGVRYHGARRSVLASRTLDADDLNDEVRAQLRRQALEWLRQDITVFSQQNDGNVGLTRSGICQLLQRWWGDPALESVRTDEALAKLPNDEREEWTQLWVDSKALMNRLSAVE